MLSRWTRRQWPAVWLGVHMLAYSAGGYWGARQPTVTEHVPAPWAPYLTRLAALLPLALVATGGTAAPLVWAGIGLSAGASGAVEAAHRGRRSHATAPQLWAPSAAVSAEGAAVVRITGWAQNAADQRWRAPARILAWRADAAAPAEAAVPAIGAGLILAGPLPAPSPGTVLARSLRIQVPPVAPLPGGFDYRQFLAGRGLSWQGRLQREPDRTDADPLPAPAVRVLPGIRRAILDRLDLLLPAREAQLAAAVLLGVRTAESRALSAPFSQLGLAHLFAVSGLHVGILLGILLLPGRIIGVSPRWLAGPLWVFVPLYLLLTGLPGSVVRAGGMGLLAAQARPYGRRACTLRILGLLYWAGAILDPGQNLDTGLRLSYLAAGGILLVGRVSDGYRFSRRRGTNVVLTGLAVSFAAQWFTLPVVASSFGQISLLSPAANLLTVPAFGLAVWAVVSALIASTVWLSLGQWLAAWGWLLLRAISGAVGWLTRHGAGLPLGLPVPGPVQVSCWLVGSAALLFILKVRPQVRSAAALQLGGVLALTVFVLVVFGPGARELPAGERIVAWQFDVGQGDCGLLVFPDGWTALIDTGGRFGNRAPPNMGPAGRQILPFLRRQGIAHLDAVILTHGHLDHTGGAQALLPAVSVARWFVGGTADEALTPGVAGDRITRPESGAVLYRWRDWELRVHDPLPEQTHGSSENNRSLVVALSRSGRAEMVWSGDLEREGESLLLAAGTDLRETRVWKAGHHGSDTSGSPAWLGQLRPQLVLISCGVDNRYGHPSHGPYLRSTAAGTDTIPLLRTDLEGSIRLLWSSDGQLQWRTRERVGQMSRLP